MLYPEIILRGFICPWKKHRDMSLERCCQSRQLYQPAADSYGQWPFGALFLNFVLAGSGVATTAIFNGCLARFKFKKVCQLAITICSRLPHQTRSLSRIVCRWQEGPKSSKDTFRPDFQAMTYAFLKKTMSQETERRVEGNPGIVRLRQFWVRNAWILHEGRRTLWWIRRVNRTKTGHSTVTGFAFLFRAPV